MFPQSQTGSKHSFSVHGASANTARRTRRWYVSIRSAVTNWWLRIRERRARREAALQLKELDDRTLRDIGLLRAEIDLIMMPNDRR
jgi:uncharacterized protein YjiS (DUF1127 family)